MAAYEASGQGAHYFLWVEKRDVAGGDVAKVFAKRFGVKESEVGIAGTKDKRGVTRQWVSLPAQNMSEEPAPEEIVEGVQILEVTRHTNKLKTGHLKGNRFEIALSDVEVGGEELHQTLASIAGQIQAEGLPNFYGEQRFGSGGSTLAMGLRWLRGGWAPRKGFLKRMAASAVQSEVFNRVLARRMREGSLRQAMDGDVFEKVDSGGRFWVEESELEETQARVDAGELLITGPMPGSRGGLADGVAGVLEREEVGSLGLKEEDFDRLKRLGRGTRRPLWVPMGELRTRVDEEGLVWFSFFLPSGSYATVLVREFNKSCGSDGFGGRFDREG